MEVQFDAQHRPVFRKHDDEHYERYIYSGDRLDHIMWATKDSIVYTYNGTNKNPDEIVFLFLQLHFTNLDTRRNHNNDI